MPYVIREGDPTTTGGMVLSGSPSFIVDSKKAARITDPVWCPECQTVGLIAEGTPSFLSDSLAVAVEGHRVQCGCPDGSNRLIATQASFSIGNTLPVRLPAERPVQPLAMTPKWAQAIEQRYPQTASTLDARNNALLASPLSDVEPGFHIVETPMSRSALEAVLFGSPEPAVLEKFRRLNPHLSSYAKPGQLVVLSDPNNYQCTREEALLMEAAAMVDDALEPLSDEEAAFMVQHKEEIESFLAYSSTSMGVSAAMAGSHLKNVENTLAAIQELHQRFFTRDGHLRSPEFFAERKRLMAQLNTNLTGLTKRTIGFPNHPKLKRAMRISSRSLVHHWSKAGAAGQIPGYASHIQGVSKASKYISAGGWIGTALGGGASFLKVQEVCLADDSVTCKKIKFTETGNFTGSLVGGALAAKAVSGTIIGSLCVALGGPTRGVSFLICGVIGVGSVTFAASKVGSGMGESAGEVLFEVLE